VSKEPEAADQAIHEARAVLTNQSDDDSAPSNRSDDILHEICEEGGWV
jgi:hypothetical protein